MQTAVAGLHLPTRCMTVARNSKLETYRAQRIFTRTAELSGEAGLGSPAERGWFVIQKQAARPLHYDLRLGVGWVFKFWAVTKGPSLDPHDRRLAVEVEGHPADVAGLTMPCKRR